MSLRIEILTVEQSTNETIFILGSLGNETNSGSTGPAGPTGPAGFDIINSSTGPIPNTILTYNTTSGEVSYNSGPVGAGLFTLEIIESFPNVQIVTPTLINSISEKKGMVQSIQGYTTPAIISFQVDLPSCIVGFSDNPSSENFSAAFEFNTNTYSILYEDKTQSNINSWTFTDTFSIIYNGFYFNYFQNELQIFSNPTKPGPYYFITSFLPSSEIITVSKINLSPYSEISNSFGYEITSWSKSEGVIININNSYNIPISGKITANQMYGGKSQGFIFSFLAFQSSSITSTTSTTSPLEYSLCCISDNIGNNFNIYLDRYVLYYSINTINGSENIIKYGNYNIGDNIQLYYNSEINEIFLYLNEIQIYNKKVSFTKSFTAYIQNNSANNINVINPMFYPYVKNSTIIPQGENYSDYLYWNPEDNIWNSGGDSIHIGTNAGLYTQGAQAIAIGYNSGLTQGAQAIAIGYNAGQTQHANSIVLNATNIPLNSTASSGTYIQPLRSSIDSEATSSLYYNTKTGELGYTIPVSTFNKNNRTYYSGKGEIINNKSVIITIPENNIELNFVIQVTTIFDGNNDNICHKVSEIKNNSFIVYGPNSKFFWTTI